MDRGLCANGEPYMNGENELKRFIQRCKSDPELFKQLSEFGVEKWGEEHLPLDIDIDKIIELASRNEYYFDKADIFTCQCKQLQNFWMFEMENSFVARRYLARIQFQISHGDSTLPGIDCYRY